MGFFAIAGAVLSALVSGAILGQAIDSYQVAEQAGKYKPELINLAKEIAAKISANNTLLSRFQNAYNSRNSELLNSIYRGMGYGPRMESLLKAIKNNDKDLDEKTKSIGSENTDLSKQYEDIQNKIANMGTSHNSNEAAGLEPTGFKKVTNALKDALSMNQNINGGITNAK